VSGLFGLLTVAILALCVRSRTNIDVAGIGLRSGYFLAVTSSRGELELAREKLPFSPDDKEGFGTYSMHLPRFDHEATTIPYRISWKTSKQGFRLSIPTWFFAACSAAAAFWFGRAIRFRFSIRTMLIATTLVAITLGLGVWLSR
jgi:hypothetical protein